MPTKTKPNIEVKPIKLSIYRRFIKGPMDFILSLMAIIFLCPVFILVSILVTGDFR